MYNNQGLRYFLYITTINKNKHLELPNDIRKYIWYLAHIYPFIECFICNKILITLNLNLNEEYQIARAEIENYSIQNGRIKCDNCYLD